MLNLFIIHDLYNGYWLGFLDLLDITSILLGIFVIVSKNPVISVLFLILLFSSIACYLILIGIKFIGICYLLVYVGAVSILFLFILMLINIKVSELTTETSNKIPLTMIIIFSFISFFINIIPDVSDKPILMANTSQINLIDLCNVASKNWDGNLVEYTDIVSIGNVMYTSYSILLLITCIILLLAMIGAIIITVKQKDE